MYLLYCSLVFLILSTYKPHRYEWFTLAIVTFLVAINTLLFDHNGSVLYYNRAVITFVGAMFLIKRKTTLVFYHAIILLTTLFMYGYLAYHVVYNTHDTIRNFYRATIYGLVGCQFISIFPTIWTAYRDYCTDSSARLVNLQRNSRT